MKRRALLCDAALLVAFAFVALIAIQMADVSIFGDLKADILAVAGVSQAAVVVWCIAMRGARLKFVAGVFAVLGLETALFSVAAACIPWRMIAHREMNTVADEVTDDLHSAQLSVTTPYDSPEFRGRDRSGTVAGISLDRDWNRDPPAEVWRHRVGSAWSSFAVVGKCCLTQEQRDEFEAVVCYELKTGKQCWAHLDPAVFRHAEGDGPRATPTVREGNVYSLGGGGILNALNGADGRRIWSVNILDENQAKNCPHGMCGSPLVVEDRVFVSPGGRGSLLVAYDAATGRRIWRGGDGDASYSSPQLAELCGKRQILIFHAGGLSSHEFESGKELWSVPWVSNPDERNNVGQPVVISPGSEADRSSVLISSAYGQGCALFDVVRSSDIFSVTKRWGNRNLKAKFSSVVIRGGSIYGLDERILTCLDVRTGERRWKGGRFGFGQLILVDDLLLVQAESGEVVLVEANPETFHELGRVQALSGRTWNSPVLAGPFLLVRNDHEAACYKLRIREK